MSTVKKFEKQPVIPDPPNTRTDTKAAFLQKADAFNPGLKAWADSFNASTVDNLNALVDVLNQQLPYINTVSDADAAIRAVYTALAQVNTVSAGMDSVNACATWMDKIKLVAENMAEIVAAKGYAEEAKKWALMAEAVVNVKPATKETLGLVMVGAGLEVDLKGALNVAPDQISSTIAGDVITVKDVAIGGDLGDLASARGQVGPARELGSNVDYNTVTEAGFYLINATGSVNGPIVGSAAFLQVFYSKKDAFTKNLYQIVYAYSSARERMFLRQYRLANNDWSSWSEIVSSSRIGDGLTVNNGIISVPEYEGATASAAGTSGLVPPAAAGQANYVLCGDGEWRDIATLVAAASVKAEEGTS